MKKFLVILTMLVRAAAAFSVTWLAQVGQALLVLRPGDSDPEQALATMIFITLPISGSLSVFAAMCLMGWKLRQGFLAIPVFMIASMLALTVALDDGGSSLEVNIYRASLPLVAAIPGIAAYIGIGDLDYVKRKRAR